MLRKWKRADVDDKGENNTNAEGQRKGQGQQVIIVEITNRCNCGVIYGFLDTNLLLPQGQIISRRKSRGTNDLLFTDKMIMREVKMRK